VDPHPAPFSRFSAAVSALLLALLAAHPGTAAETTSVEAERSRLRAAGFEQMLQEDQTLLRVSDRIRRSGKGLCGEKLSPVWGLTVAAPKDLPWAYRGPAEKAVFGREGVFVLAVEPGAPAARAGIEPGDVVLALADRPVHQAVDLGWRGDAQLAGQSTLRVRRGGEVRDLPVDVEIGCALLPVLAYRDDVNAYASRNWREMVVFTGLLRFVNSDDELALVIGHELSHVILETGGFRETEADADYLGAYLAARAGYDISNAVGVWRRWGCESLLVLPDFYSHPMPAQRFVALQQTVREIEAKRARGEPLEPKDRQ
jgi:hypothetical protein